jgi:hypothetical protein
VHEHACFRQIAERDKDKKELYVQTGRERPIKPSLQISGRPLVDITLSLHGLFLLHGTNQPGNTQTVSANVQVLRCGTYGTSGRKRGIFVFIEFGVGESNISLVAVVALVGIYRSGILRKYTEEWFFRPDRLFEKYFSGTYLVLCVADLTSLGQARVDGSGFKTGLFGWLPFGLLRTFAYTVPGRNQGIQ